MEVNALNFSQNDLLSIENNINVENDICSLVNKHTNVYGITVNKIEIKGVKPINRDKVFKISGDDIGLPKTQIA